MRQRESTPNYVKRNGDGYSFGHTSYHGSSIASILREAMKLAYPYHVELVAHFMIFCSTIFVLVLMLSLSHVIISICEGTLNIDPLFMKFIVYSSDIFISAHFIKYLMQTWPH